MNSRLGPLSPSALEGVVLDRRPKYIDISLRGMDSMQIDVSADYRLDCFVNRVSYDRMLESLQLLLQSSVSSSSSSVSELKISQAIKDLLLYSYPNSMLRLARSPGGLKLALPALHFNHLRISNDDDAVDLDVDGDGDLDRVGVSVINEVGGVIGDGSVGGDNRLINTMSRSDVGVQHEVTTTTTSAVAAVVDEDDSILAIDRISIVEPSPATALSSINNPTIESSSL
jgi:hypothetical protein